MINFKETFSDIPGLIVSIRRILTNKSTFKNFKLIPIQNSAYFYFGLAIDKDPLILPKLYVALTHLTGSGDDKYDDYKGSYSFIFELEVDKNNNKSKYCYHIYHYRSYIEFSVYHIVPKSDPREHTSYHQPDDRLFSDNDICYFSSYFCGYALGYIKGSKYKPMPFMKCSDSNLILFGYFKDKYFCKEYEDYDQYTKKKEVLENKLGDFNIVDSM